VQNFKSFLLEQEQSREIPWKTHPQTWIGDDKEESHIYLYHGTHKKNRQSVVNNGITHADPKTGKVSYALDPHTGRGYAAMSGSGGEYQFRRAGAKVQNVPMSDRDVHVWRVPKALVRKHMADMRGNLEGEKDKLTNKDRFEKTVKAGKEHPYSLAEVRFTPEISKQIHKYYVGHMSKG